MVSTDVARITRHTCTSRIQATGRSPISRSRIVPPPTDVTNAMISTPNASKRRCMAEKVPDMAKEIVPSNSIMADVLENIKCKIRNSERLILKIAGKTGGKTVSSTTYSGYYFVLTDYSDLHRFPLNFLLNRQAFCANLWLL